MTKITETIDRLFLELSQFTSAKTGRELKLERALASSRGRLSRVDHATDLATCPVGLFETSTGTLCLKTEYCNSEGRIDAYIVSSGEFFWGEHPQTIENQRKQKVWPIVVLQQGDEIQWTE